MKAMMRFFLCAALLILGEVWSQAVIVTREQGIQNSNDKDVTDEERHKSQTFVNEALSNKIIQEECAKLDDPKACQGQGQSKIFGIDSKMISMAAKAYSTLMGSMFKGGLEPKAEDKDNKNDYCILIGSGAEAVGLFMLQTSSESIRSPVGGATDQKKILYKAARSHRDRAKTASVKAAGWAGATACYVTMMSSGSIATKSKKNILKAAAAGVLTTFYFKERELHKNFSNQVKKIADKLPGPGDCNPVTEKDCYCALEEYQNDPKYCVSYLHKKKLSQGSILRTACTNQKLQADPNCQCMATDTCLDKTLKNAFVATGVGSGFVNSPIGKDVVSLTRGELKNGALTSSQMGKNVGLNKFFRNLKEDQLPSRPSLTPSQGRNISRLSQSFGLTPALYRHLVAAPTPPDLSISMAKLGGKSDSIPMGKITKTKDKGQVWNFRGGQGLRGQKKTTANPSFGFDFKKYLARGKKKKSPQAGNILEFNQRAINAAEVGKNSEKNIFRIISRRYILWESRQ